MANPYVFIVGCPRSGTTLLQRMVDAHPLIAITREAHWIYEYFEGRRGVTPEGLATPELISHLLKEPRFTRLQVDREKLEALVATGPPVPYRDFVAHIFDLYGQHTAKALVGNKTPNFVRSLEALHALWPAARFVHLIRDGRDVCLSVAKCPKAQHKEPGIFATWKDDSVSTTALYWELNVRLGRQAGNLVGPELYYELRYESLVAHPEEECAALCAFLGLPYDDAMLRFHEGRTRSKPGLDAKHAWLPITRVCEIGDRKCRVKMWSDLRRRLESCSMSWATRVAFRVRGRKVWKRHRESVTYWLRIRTGSKLSRVLRQKTLSLRRESLTRGRRDPRAAV